MATILWDMEKLNDNIDILKLVHNAAHKGYNATFLALGLQMHMAPRLVKARDAYAYCKLPANGIIAGCTQSNTFARIFLYFVLHARYNDTSLKADATYIRQFVDDIRESHYDADVTRLKADAVRQALALGTGLVGLGCKIFIKTTILASTKALRQAIAKSLAHRLPEIYDCAYG